MKADVLFVHLLHEDRLIFESFSLVRFDFPRPPGTWEYIDLQRDCTQSRLSEGNEARPTAIFTRDVLDMRFLMCMCVTVWSFAAFWMVRHSKNRLLLCNIYFSLKYPLQPIVVLFLMRWCIIALKNLNIIPNPPFPSPPLSSPQVLKGSKKLCLSVRSVGRIPGGYVTNHVYTWVDPQGRSVSPPPDLPEHRSATLRKSDSQRRSNMQLLQEGDEKKVRHVRNKTS